MVNTYPSMAGSGNPWEYWSAHRRKILEKIHEGLTTEEIAQVFNQSTDQILSELEPLLTANLIKLGIEGFTPAFFMVDHRETVKVYEHAEITGHKLVETLMPLWGLLEAGYRELSPSKQYPFSEQSFMLVGSRILDIGILTALTRDRTLLTEAPMRPSPDRPDAQYYFWMIEGEPKHLGKYGQNDTSLPWMDWHLLTFGKNMIDNKNNAAREEFEEESRELIESNSIENPQTLAEALNTPFLNKEESKQWATLSKDTSEKLLTTLKENKEEFHKLLNGLKASKYTSNSFGEFFCWYYHLVFASAIDTLIEKKLITPPNDWYSPIILYRTGREGILAA